MLVHMQQKRFGPARILYGQCFCFIRTISLSVFVHVFIITCVVRNRQLCAALLWMHCISTWTVHGTSCEFEMDVCLIAVCLWTKRPLTIDWTSMKRVHKCVCVNSQLHNYWTECVINAICLRREGQVLIPWAVPRVWHCWLAALTSIFQRSLEINLFLRCSDLFAHLFWFSQISHRLVQLTRPLPRFAAAFLWIIGFGSACFVFLDLKLL